MSTIVDAGGSDLLDEYGRPLFDEEIDPRPLSADYADAITAHLPFGRAWSRDPSSILSRIVGTLASTFSRLDQRARYLLTDSPSSTGPVELLPEWEATLGLPDTCSGPLPTVSLRQAAVKAGIAARGGQSVPYFTGVAAALGYPISIEEFAPARYGRPNYGKPRYGRDWAHTWRIHAPAIVITPAQYGLHRSGELYATWQSNPLLCTIGRIRPAHTTMLLAYTGS